MWALGVNYSTNGVPTGEDDFVPTDALFFVNPKIGGLTHSSKHDSASFTYR